MMIGSRKTTPARMLRIVPFGDTHIFFRPNSSTRSSSGVIVAHFTPTPCSLMAFAASTVIWSSVASRLSMLRSKYLRSISRYGWIRRSLMNCQMIRVISSPSSSTTGFFTLILAMECVSQRSRNSLDVKIPGTRLRRHLGGPVTHADRSDVGTSTVTYASRFTSDVGGDGGLLASGTFVVAHQHRSPARSRREQYPRQGGRHRRRRPDRLQPALPHRQRCPARTGHPGAAPTPGDHPGTEGTRGCRHGARRLRVPDAGWCRDRRRRLQHLRRREPRAARRRPPPRQGYGTR